jgi:hypothetical protein
VPSPSFGCNPTRILDDWFKPVWALRSPCLLCDSQSPSNAFQQSRDRRPVLGDVVHERVIALLAQVGRDDWTVTSLGIARLLDIARLLGITHTNGSPVD